MTKEELIDSILSPDPTDDTVQTMQAMAAEEISVLVRSIILKILQINLGVWELVESFYRV